MGEHIVNGEFQSDKYPWCKPGFVPLKLSDSSCWPMLLDYAEVRKDIDPEFSDDLRTAVNDARCIKTLKAKRETTTIVTELARARIKAAHELVVKMAKETDEIDEPN